MYFLAEQALFKERMSDEQGLSAFARLGFADDRINQFGSNFSIGGIYTGLIPGRDNDKVGVGLTYAAGGRHYKEAMATSGTRVVGGELTIEWTYRARLTPWLAVQPDLQHAVNPNAESEIRNATTFGARVEVGF